MARRKPQAAGWRATLAVVAAVSCAILALHLRLAGADAPPELSVWYDDKSDLEKEYFDCILQHNVPDLKAKLALYPELVFATCRASDDERIRTGQGYFRLEQDQLGGWTGLHLAVYLRDPAMVDALLDAGARPNALDFDRRSPLYDALFERLDAPMAAQLIRRGADVNGPAQDHRDNNLLEAAILGYGLGATSQAQVTQFLIEHGANPWLPAHLDRYLYDPDPDKRVEAPSPPLFQLPLWINAHHWNQIVPVYAIDWKNVTSLRLLHGAVRILPGWVEVPPLMLLVALVALWGWRSVRRTAQTLRRGRTMAERLDLPARLWPFIDQYSPREQEAQARTVMWLKAFPQLALILLTAVSLCGLAVALDPLLVRDETGWTVLGGTAALWLLFPLKNVASAWLRYLFLSVWLGVAGVVGVALFGLTYAAGKVLDEKWLAALFLVGVIAMALQIALTVGLLKMNLVNLRFRRSLAQAAKAELRARDTVDVDVAAGWDQQG